MCWIENMERVDIQIADKDIEVYKIVLEATKKSCESCIKGFVYEVNTIYKIPSMKIEKTYIDSLLQASKNVNLLIKSIEPLSFCAIRYKNTFQQETYIFEIYKYSASIVMYSPLAGLFKMNLSKEYTIDNLKTKTSFVSFWLLS